MFLTLATEVFSVIAPLFVLAGIGWFWAKSGKPFQFETVSLLATNVGTPCLVVHTLLTAEVDGSTLWTMTLAAFVALATFMLASALLLKLLKLPLRDFIASLTFPNAGNAGLSLALFAYGQEGLALGILFFAVASLGNWTVGQSIYAGRGNWREVVRSPMIWAVLFGIAGNRLGLHPPLWIMQSLKVAGGIAIPLMLLMLGVSLATLKVQDLRNGLILSALRLGLGIAVGLGLSHALDLQGAARGVFIIQCAMPAAVINYVFAVRYGRDSAGVASLVVISTLLSFATLPVLLAMVLR